jgi:molybdopterin-dependent oxidoreductase alpha subunit
MPRDPSETALPFGLGAQKPKHYREMLRVMWDNREALGYAYRVLRDGVCDGCALGTSGMSDWTMEGTHLCLVRLNLLRLNTLGPLDPARLADASSLADMRQRDLHELGRLPCPMVRRRGEPGFAPTSWEQALADIGARLGKAEPDRIAAYLTSRGIGNEVYYAVQKVMRFLGSPHVDNAARLCHSPSTAAMKKVLGVAASTCSYRDWYGSDVVVFFGSNPANDQPVAVKYLAEAKKLGTQVLMVNTYREPGMDRYWVPSSARSAFFGTDIADAFYGVSAGGDQAFIYAVQKLLLARGAADFAFIGEHTTGFEGYAAHLDGYELDELVARAGTTREQVEDFAERLAAARTGVFVWSMGLTQHATGTQTIESLCCLGLSKGFVGREKCGLMPIRGHSGVQGGAEMGAYATVFPGGKPIDNAHADALQAVWGFRPPVRVGMDTAAMLEAAMAGRLEALYAIGGNFVDTLPQPADVERALANIPLRIHQDILVSRAMLVEPADTVYLLPAKTRYEHVGGITETTTERRVVFSPHIPGHDIAEAREEWRIAIDIARAARPAHADRIDYRDAGAIRRDIAATVDTYAGIEKLQEKGDQFQWGGARLCADGVFPLPGSKARFLTSEPRDTRRPGGRFLLGTRRGKQFNSIVQGEVDALTGAARDHLFMNVDDMRAQSLAQDQPVRVRSQHGEVRARAFAADITRGNVQMHWPEANPLLPAGRRDPGGLVPDYNAEVTIVADTEAAGAGGG